LSGRERRHTSQKELRKVKAMLSRAPLDDLFDAALAKEQAARDRAFLAEHLLDTN